VLFHGRLVDEKVVIEEGLTASLVAAEIRNEGRYFTVFSAEE
jgi:hypothetical protein